jgi:hypothetical protein
MEATLIRLNRHWEGQKYLSLHERSLVENLKKKKITSYSGINGYPSKWEINYFPAVDKRFDR